MQSSNTTTWIDALTPTRRSLPWIYGAVVAISLVAGCLMERSAESAVCLVMVGAAVAGFLVIADRIGLWRRS